MPSLKTKISVAAPVLIVAKTAKPKPEESLPTAKPRKKYRFKSGTVSLREIKKMQTTTKLLIQHSPFKRIVKEITADFIPDIIYQKSAMEALQEAAEDYIVDIFKSANKQAKYCNRKTITVGDVKMST